MERGRSFLAALFVPLISIDVRVRFVVVWVGGGLKFVWAVRVEYKQKMRGGMRCGGGFAMVFGMRRC